MVGDFWSKARRKFCTIVTIAAIRFTSSLITTNKKRGRIEEH
jgi:hypothetical protein